MTHSVERYTYRMLQVSHRFQLALRNQRRRFGSHFLLEALQEPFDTNVPFSARYICSVVGPSFVKHDSMETVELVSEPGFSVQFAAWTSCAVKLQEEKAQLAPSLPPEQIQPGP